MQATTEPDPEPRKKIGRAWRTFENQRKLNRVAYGKHIEKVIKGTAGWVHMTCEKRWELVQEQREEKMKCKKDKNQGCTKFDFDERHDDAYERKELKWLYNKFNVAILTGRQGDVGIGGGGADAAWQDEDDEEPMPNKAGLGIKTKEAENDATAEASYQVVANHRQLADAEGREDKKLVTYEPVSHGFFIKCNGFNDVKVKADSTPGVKSTNKLELEMDNDGHVAKRASGSTTRAWRWIDGKMVVWPPFEDDKEETMLEVRMDMT